MKTRNVALPESSKYETWAECFEGYGIPAHLHGGLERYITEHIRPGRFLCSVIDNNLVEAVTRADEESLRALRSITLLLYNEAPAPCLKREEWEQK